MAHIWFHDDPQQLLKLPMLARGLAPHLGIELLDIGDDWLSARMPVDERTRQPFGLLHGGASVALAETLASIGSAFIVDPAKYQCVGLEINANHLRAVTDGWVTGTARPIHAGRTSHVWDIRLVDEQNRPTCVSRCTMAVVERRG